MSASSLVVGVEGGGTKTTFSILDVSTGESVWTKCIPESTNHWLVGIPKVCSTIDEVLITATSELNLTAPAFAAIGMTMAGVEAGSSETGELVEAVAKLNHFPDTAVLAMNDSGGAGFCLGDDGGLVLIAGTGSMGRVITMNTQFHSPAGLGGIAVDDRVGGWGHLIGDEGSGYYIAHRAVKTVWRSDDGMDVGYDVSKVRELIYKHFDFTARDDVMRTWCAPETFSKGVCASICGEIAGLALEGDEFAMDLFTRAGKWLGRMAAGIVAKAVKLGMTSNLRLGAVGSVWKSLRLFEQAFVDEVLPVTTRLNVSLEVVGIEMTAALGIAWRAAAMTGGEPKLERVEGRDFKVLMKL